MKLSSMLAIASRVASKQYACDAECSVPDHKQQRKDKEINYDKIPPEYLKEKVSTDMRGNFQWTIPKLEDLDPVISKTAKELHFDKDYLSSKISIAIDQQHYRTLDDAIWSRLNNTDSWRVQTRDEAEFIASLHDKEHQLEVFLEVMGKGSALASPIALIQNGETYLIDGNIRLMACRILGIQPQVLFVDV